MVILHKSLVLTAYSSVKEGKAKCKIFPLDCLSYKEVFRIRIHIILVDPYPYHDTNLGSKKSAKIMGNSHKLDQNQLHIWMALQILQTRYTIYCTYIHCPMPQHTGIYI